MNLFMSPRVRLTIAVVGIGVLVGLGFWYRVLGENGLAARAFGAAAAVGVIAAIGAALRILSHRGTMPTAIMDVSVDIDPETALPDIAHALLVLDENGEVTLDAGSRSAWLDTRWSWKSVGERVTAEFDGRVIRVTSQSRSPVLVDYGKNRANVDKVIAALERLHARSDPLD